ncbi:MAG: GNAT family N-acetyltransferase [Actinobacteria bacterium]|nr:GNAT family N-acetyltransferase [Actinomycetota bacterium]
MEELLHFRLVVTPARHREPLPVDLRPAESSVYPGDDHPSTVHLGAFLEDQLVGIASLYAERRGTGKAEGPGWRLRGMASSPEVRGRGVGRALLHACVEHVARRGGGELWCNARMPAVPFYATSGFEVVSEQFDIPDIGPHVVMRRMVRGNRRGRSVLGHPGR